MSLVLYGHPFSSYTWKAEIALHANGLGFELREFGSNADHNAFIERTHPAAKFPILVDGDTTIVEATSIVEYIAVHHAGPAPLIPGEPDEALKARMLDRVFDNYVMANGQRAVSAYLKNPDDPDPVELAAAKEGLLRAYSWLEDWLGSNLMPPHVSLVTCAAAPSLFYADWIERIPERCGRVAALRAELLALSPVSRCVEAARPYRALFPPGAPDRD